MVCPVPETGGADLVEIQNSLIKTWWSVHGKGSVMTNTRKFFPSRGAAATAALALAGAALIAPSVAPDVVATPAFAQDAATECEVTDVTLEWGVLERFRTYILGSIAKGDWTLDGNVTYETPTFTWSGGEGTLNPDGSSANIGFTGSVLFSAHGGLLAVELANPTLEIISPDEAYLRLDLTATNTSGEPTVSVIQERAVKLDVAGSAADGDRIVFEGVSGTLTAEGASAFGGFYEEGQPVDSITVTVPSCVIEQPVVDEPVEEPPAVEAAPEEVVAEPEPTNIPWLPIGIGAGAIVLIAVAATLLISGRKKQALGGETPENPAE